MSEHTAQQEPQLSAAFVHPATVLSVIGTLTSFYTIKHHLDLKAQGATAAICNINAQFNCDAVAQSAYAEWSGIPLGVFGAGYFLSMLLYCVMLLTKNRIQEARLGYAIMSMVGVLVSFGLGFIAKTKIGVFCPSCLVVYGICLLQLGLSVWQRRALLHTFNLKHAGNGIFHGIIVCLLAIAGYNTFAPSAPLGQKVVDSKVANVNEEIPLLSSTQHTIPIAKSAYTGLGEDFRKGSDSAKVVIVEFADFQCPACRSMAQILDELYREFGGKVQVVYKNFPLDKNCNPSMSRQLHEFACEAAAVARCAGQQGKFWNFFDRAFQNQNDMSKESIQAWAIASGLNEEQLTECAQQPGIMAKIKDDLAMGERLGVEGTPTVFINGKKYLGNAEIDSLRRAILTFNP